MATKMKLKVSICMYIYIFWFCHHLSINTHSLIICYTWNSKQELLLSKFMFKKKNNLYSRKKNVKEASSEQIYIHSRLKERILNNFFLSPNKISVNLGVISIKWEEQRFCLLTHRYLGRDQLTLVSQGAERIILIQVDSMRLCLS